MTAAPTGAPASGVSEDRVPGAEIEPLTALGESFKAAMGAVRRLRGRESHRNDKLSFA